MRNQIKKNNSTLTTPLYSVLAGLFVLLGTPSESYGSSQYSQNRCAGLIAETPTEGLEEVMGLFFKTTTKGKMDPDTRLNSFFDMAWNSPRFKLDLVKKSVEWRDDESLSRKYVLVGEYVHRNLSRFMNNESLRRYQNRVMKKVLRDRGIYTSTSETWQEALQKQSRSNLERMLGGIGQFRPESQEIVDAVSDIEMYLAHNSHAMNERPNYPLVAPVILQQMGLNNFGASTTAFHRLIGSDQMVYFYVTFKRKSDHSIAIRSEYGQNGVILKSEAAKRTAFISPFVMYNVDLASAAQLVDPVLATRYWNANTRYDGKYPTWLSDEDDVQTPELVKEIQKLLGRVDFTVEDAELLVKTFAIKKLQDLKTSDPKKYLETMDTLHFGTKFAIGLFFTEEILRPLGFVGGLEGRVAVAVGSNDLIHFSQ